MDSKCMYCDDLERAVSHTSTNSSSEMSCTILTSLYSCLSKLIWFHFVKQCDASAKWKYCLLENSSELTYVGRGNLGLNFLAVWREGDCCGLWVMWFCCLVGDGLFVGCDWGFFQCMDLHMLKWCYSVCVCRSYHLTKEQGVLCYKKHKLGFLLILCWLILSKFLWSAEFVKL